MSTLDERCALWLQNVESKPAPLSPRPDSPRDSAVGVAPQKRKRDEKSIMDDPDVTPIPARKHARVDNDDDNETGTQSRGSSPSKRSNVSSTGSRVARQRNWMEAFEHHRERELLGQAPDSFPTHVSQLIDQLYQHADGSSTIPESLRSAVQTHEPQTVNSRRPDLFYPDAALEQEPSWREIRNIVDEAKRCSARQDFDAGWNSHVHGPLLVLACSVLPFQTIKSVNITHVVPFRRLSPYIGRRKMVDFGLYIEESDFLRWAFTSDRLRAESDGFKTWNPTDQEQVAKTPLVVCMETKREDGKDAEARLQLSSWTQAHLKKILELRNQDIEEKGSICLPHVTMVGPVWNFSLTVGEFNESGFLERTTLYRGLAMGNVTTYAGCLRVLACLRKICGWVHNHYRPWLETWVSGGTHTGGLPAGVR